MSNDERTGNVVTETDTSKILALTEALRAIMLEKPQTRFNFGERCVKIAERALKLADPEAYEAALEARTFDPGVYHSVAPSD